MGCHSSIGFYKTFDSKTNSSTTWSQLGGDFTWLLQQKARMVAPGSTGSHIGTNNYRLSSHAGISCASVVIN
jgi:hypothetical protein